MWQAGGLLGCELTLVVGLQTCMIMQSLLGEGVDKWSDVARHRLVRNSMDVSCHMFLLAVRA